MAPVRPLRRGDSQTKHVHAVIFDWAGTVVDHDSLAPMGAFVETFAGFGVDVTVEEAGPS